jgi:hypothetical protein
MHTTGHAIDLNRIIDLAIVHVASALDDHPEGATNEVLADFAVDQVCDSEEITIEEWQLARSALFTTAVLRLVLAARETGDDVATYRLCASPSPEYVSFWRRWAEDVLLSAAVIASGARR